MRDSVATYMVYCGESAVWSSYSPAGISEAFKCLLWLLCERERLKPFYTVRGLPTGDVTSWTRCLSAHLSCQYRTRRTHNVKRTNVKEDCAIVLLLDNVVLKDLVVQSLWRFHGRRHRVYVRWELRKSIQSIRFNESTHQLDGKNSKGQKMTGFSARASIGLNEAHVELKSFKGDQGTKRCRPMPESAVGGGDAAHQPLPDLTANTAAAWPSLYLRYAMSVIAVRNATITRRSSLNVAFMALHKPVRVSFPQPMTREHGFLPRLRYAPLQRVSCKVSFSADTLIRCDHTYTQKPHDLDTSAARWLPELLYIQLRLLSL